MTAAVEASGWGWRHAGRRDWALRHLDLVVEPGERVLLAGPSGAGKSTLLAALAGILHAPASGDEEGVLRVAGLPATASTGRSGLVFQDPAASLVMGRLGDEVAFGLENRAVPEAEIWPRVRAALDDAGLSYPLDRSTECLSGGEQQRLAIAGVLATDPELLLLDEPTANLDPQGAELVRTTLRRLLRRTGSRPVTLLLVEHRLAPALELIDRVVVLQAGGGVGADGPPGDVFSRSGVDLRRVGVWVPSPPPVRRASSRTAGDPVLDAEQLTVRYGASSRAAVDRVDLTMHGGQVVALTGPNGSGKSTLALALGSLIAPSSGTVRFLAGGPAGPYPRWRAQDLIRHVGTIFQNPEHQFLTANVGAELALGPRRAGMTTAQVATRVEELLDRLQLGHLVAANPFTLSGGEKRRLSVATALATRPRLLLLDEPTFGQDARMWDQLVSLLAAERDAGQAVLAVTHDQDLVGALADRHLSLGEGRLQPVPDAV